MSATINQKDLKFVVFGSGHDYTLLDSGEGDGAMIFSHPFMPKGARAYAGMYYFLVPDENGNPMDAVKDDIASCTFTPALGDTFDTVGEVEVKVYYRHEYIHDEETILVEKTVTQKITVVDHGTVTTSYFNQNIYTDGYCYVHPSSDYVSRSDGYWLSGSFKKISAFPFGTVSISNMSTALEDASEFGYTDVSGFTSFQKLFYGCNKLTDISNFDLLDISHVKNLSETFGGCSSLVDITPLKTWVTKQVTNFKGFLWGTGITNTDGLQNFKFDSADSLEKFFYSCASLTDLSGISGWDVSMIEIMIETFYRCFSLTDLTPLKDWNTGEVFNATRMFAGNYTGAHCGKLLSLNGLEDWDVSHVIIFTGMLAYQYWLTDISALSGWDVHLGSNFDDMFLGVACANLSALSGWNMSNATSLSHMFELSKKKWSDKIGKYVVDWSSSQYIGYDDTIYMSYQVTPPALEPIEQDASAVSGWSVPSGSNAFFDGGSATWINIPSWN